MIKINGLNKIYNKNQQNEFLALKDVDLLIETGEFVGIIGTSGAGKSTLLHIMSGIDSFEKGSVIIDGDELSQMSDKELSVYRSKKIGVVMQDFALLEEYSVHDNVVIPLEFSTKMSVKLKKKLVIDTLEKVGISHLVQKRVNQLSGGEKQRVAIARAIINSPKILFADEPTGALDESTSKQIMDLFTKLNKEGITIVIITHDINIANRCSRIVRIEDGRIVEY